MVKYPETVLDRTFAALADPTRRALLARLSAEESLSVSELARPFPMSLPAVMKHLDVLAEAGLVTRAKSGRTVSCRLRAQPMESAMDWLSRYERFWTDQLDRLAAFVEAPECPTTPSPTRPASTPAPASRSSAGSGRARPRSTPPGRSRRS